MPTLQVDIAVLDNGQPLNTKLRVRSITTLEGAYPLAESKDGGRVHGWCVASLRHFVAYHTSAYGGLR